MRLFPFGEVPSSSFAIFGFRANLRMNRPKRSGGVVIRLGCFAFRVALLLHSQLGLRS